MTKTCFSCLVLVALATACSVATKTVSTGGTLIGKTVTTAGSVATATGGATLKVAGAVAKTGVTTTAKVATTTVSAAATAGQGTLHAATQAAAVPFVTFRDASTGVSRQVPWSQGLKLFAASQTAQFDPYLKAFQILRESMVIHANWKQIKSGAPEPELRPRDVVLVSQAAAPPLPARAGKGF